MRLPRRELRMLLKSMQRSRTAAMERMDEKYYAGHYEWRGCVGIYAESAADFLKGLRDQMAEGPIGADLIVASLLDDATYWAEETVDDPGAETAVTERVAATRVAELLREVLDLMLGPLSIMGHGIERWRLPSAHCGRSSLQRHAACDASDDCRCGCDMCVAAIVGAKEAERVGRRAMDEAEREDDEAAE